ncbi:glucose/arabinose dehydrogenase [Lachnotalea glycerini]|uniref:Glucose/arabinose dehydrogenase n=1 Tax=Lachnotalea glycerini TaxID=1763509 RepID=A0A318EV42_9FIRM|nr:PQQ-dependent sugar dehydrogenase [Lachnotalea glycerini]PXV93623.1 glucose/arabinose dehydrogenase [Lachnotalea glycerini]
MYHLLFTLLACQVMSNLNTPRKSTMDVGIEKAQVNEFPYEIEVVANNLNIPWALAVDNRNDIYFTERIGNIWIIEEGELYNKPLYTFDYPFQSTSEGGLMGIALDEDFENNGYLYVMYTYRDQGRLNNAIARLVRTNHELIFNQVLLDKIPGGRTHNGGRIKIGPDGKLYITTGDAEVPELAQDLTSMAGKILRINVDGSIPLDNPFSNSPVYSYGFRNPQGLAWDTNGILYASEHGTNANDEINVIVPGGNYGWPNVQGDKTQDAISIQMPLLQSGEITWAPSGMDFANQGPWKGKLMVANLRGEQLLVITIFETEEGNKEASAEGWLYREYGRLRDVVRGNDGSVYIATNNRDGRGNPRFMDDKILRLVLTEKFSASLSKGKYFQ